MSESASPHHHDGDLNMSSPVVSHKTLSTPQLTPNSKIKALLAAVDDGSESDGGRNKSPPRMKRIPLAERDYNIQTYRSSITRKAQPFKDDSEDNSDDELPVLPQGRLARALQKRRLSPDPMAAEKDSEESDGQGAYERVKKLMMTKKPACSPAGYGDNVSDEVAMLGDSNGQATSPIVGKSYAAPTASQTRSSEPPVPSAFSPQPNMESPRHSDNDGSESDLPAEPTKDDKFWERVARKREEREAVEASKKKMHKKSNRLNAEHDLSDLDDASGSDIELNRRLTQQNRPARKASKKALEEMNRETQRMSRNMQLAHQAKTKRKITKESLLARFNFRTGPTQPFEVKVPANQPSNSSSNPPSDHEDIRAIETPPTSPLVPKDPNSPAHKTDQPETKSIFAPEFASAEVEDLPDITNVLHKSLVKLDKGKGKAPLNGEALPSPSCKSEPQQLSKQRNIRVRSPNLPSRALSKALDSDSDLEILPIGKRRPSRLDAFSRAPKVNNADARPLQTLRALAHLTSPQRKAARAGRPSINHHEMQSTLQRMARLQALELQQARIEELKAKGIFIQTAEEKQHEQLEVEDLLEKARKEDEALREHEKRAARKQKQEDGDPQAMIESTDEEDEDYEDGNVDEADIELSGSGEDELEEDGEASGVEDDADDALDHLEDGVDPGHGRSNLIEDEASDDSREEPDIEDDDGGEDEERDEGIPQVQTRRPRRTHAIIDDEDETQDNTPAISQPAASPSQETSGVEVPMIFRQRQNSMLLGMTQAFAATMADTETQPEDTQIDSLPFGSPPEPRIPGFPAEDSLQMAGHHLDYPDISSAMETQDFDESRAEEMPTALPALPSNTQLTEMPDPTQDAGFVLSSPGPDQRFVSEPPSTVATVIIPQAEDPTSPTIKKRGRLQRRQPEKHLVTSDDETSDKDEGPTPSEPTDAFLAMKVARKRAMEKELFDKKKSEAKEMVEEQAQESDDEYAGLGGASDEDDGGEDDELVKAMIDQDEVDVDERKLAALYANKQRVEDDKAIQKLFKDINNGGLRRKRGNEFDLSDSDDDGEARRRQKQREFAKMRKALMQNENVGKIAEDPKKSAFFKAIEDREGDEELDFLADRPTEDSFRVEMETQNDETPLNETIQESPEEAPPNDPRPNSAPEQTTMRPPPSKRRTQVPKRPSTLAEIKESVSFLTEDPAAHTINSFSSSDEDDEVPQTQYPNHNHPRRTSANPIIDRLTLKRESCSSASASAGAANSAMAFHAPAAMGGSSQFVPSLLRRATTSGLSGVIGGGEGTAATERAAGGKENEFVGKKGGGKRSSVNFAVREGVKKGLVDQVERRRREGKERMAREREKVGLAGLRRSGTWD